MTEPEYWHNPRFGGERRGYPVVGVSWYEAQAYCRWLQHQLGTEAELPVWKVGQPETWNLEPGTLSIRLPADAEWTALAGGLVDAKRYPWDPPQGPAMADEASVLARANASEAELGGSSLVGMYPLGASQPFGLMDLAGNVWEWTSSLYRSGSSGLVLRGGSWYCGWDDSGCAARVYNHPSDSIDLLGFRCVSPISLS